MKVSRSRKFSNSRFKILVLFTLFASAALTPAILRAQGEASIWGMVTDSSGAAVPAASVKVQNIETGATRGIATDLQGRYDAPLLPVGSYTVTVEKTGFQAQTKTDVPLVVGERVEVDVALGVTQLQQSVTVTEHPDFVAVTNEDISGLVGEQQVKDLPLNGRSYDQLLTLNPGIVNYTSQRSGGIGTSNSVVGNMFAASGRRPQENLYLLNGVEYTSASEINTTPGGVSGQLLGVDSVREFSVVSDTYGAEYGKRPGAQINIVTASGSNQLHGNAYEFLRNSALDARNYFDHGPIPPFERNMFGGSLGGPIKKDKTFLFANYEGFRQKLGLSDLTLVPDATSRAAAVASIKPLLALWPVANGPELLNSTGRQRHRRSFHQSHSAHPRRFRQHPLRPDLFGQGHARRRPTPSTTARAIRPSSNPITFIDIFLREQVVSLNETHIFSPSSLTKPLSAFPAASFISIAPRRLSLPGWIHPGQPVGALVVGGGTTLNGASQITNGGTNAGSNLTAARNLFTLSDQVTVTHGKHLLNAGVWFQPMQANDTLAQDQYGQASFTSLQTFLQAPSAPTPTLPALSLRSNWRSFEGAFYAEDAIKLMPSLELRLGFRGEFTNGWNEANGRASNYVFRRKWRHPDQARHRLLALATNNADVSSRAAHRHGLVAIRLEDNRDPRRLRHLLRAARQSQLPARSERAVQHHLAVKSIPATTSILNISPTATYRPGSTTGDSQRRRPESEDADRRILFAENRAADRPDHHA